MTRWTLALRRFAERGSTRVMSPAAQIRLERRLRGWFEWRRLRRADAAVVSFGKSGRTWLRVMLSRFYRVRHDLPADELIEFDNLHRLDGAVPRILFTHDNYLGDWTGNRATKTDYARLPVVLLVRHPADTAVSQYHQWRHRMRPHKKVINAYPPHGAELDVFDFVMGEGGGLPRIVEFMNTWARALPALPRVRVVRYEDLRRDTGGELAAVLDFLGTPGDAGAVDDAVDYASFERMRARESSGETGQEGGSRLAAADPDNPDSFKTRRAKVGGYREDFTADQVRTIDAYVARHLDPLFGYGDHPARPDAGDGTGRSSPAAGTAR